jgi:hypothetical protein
VTTYWFTLRLDGPAADTDAFSEALYADGHDCVLTTTDGTVRADQTVRVAALEVEEGHSLAEAFAA